MKQHHPLMRIALLWLVCFGACETPTPMLLTSDDLEQVSDWTPAGILSYLGPAAFEKYNIRGTELLAAAYGGPVEISLPLLKAQIRLAPTELKASILDGGQGISLIATFQSNLVTEHVPDCASAWLPGTVEIDLQMSFDFDDIGSIKADADTYQLRVKESTFEKIDTCSESILGGWQTEYQVAVDNAFSDRTPIVRLAKAMLGSEKGYVLEVGPQATVFTAPQPTASTDTMTQGMLVRPSRIAMQTTPSTCIPDSVRTNLSYQPADTIPAPSIDLEAETTDWAFAWRIDLLQHSIEMLASSGYFCRTDGLSRAPSTTYTPSTGESLGVSLPSHIPADAELAWSITPQSLPLLDVASDGSITVSFPKARIRLFIIRWSMPHLVDEYAGPVQLTQASLALRNRVVVIDNGSWTTPNTNSYWGPLLTSVTRQAAATIPIGTLQAGFPFPSFIDRVTRTEHHILAWCNFDNETPPTSTIRGSTNNSLQSTNAQYSSIGSTGCSTNETTRPPATPWLILLVLALTGLRRSVIVPVSKETNS